MTASGRSNFSKGLSSLPPDDDNLPNHDEADDNVPVTRNERKDAEIDDEVGVAVVFDEEEQESDEEEAFEISESVRLHLRLAEMPKLTRILFTLIPSILGAAPCQ